MLRMVAFRNGLEAVFVIADYSTGVAYPLRGKNVLNKVWEILNPKHRGLCPRPRKP
ncbi:MAG: hypothetical protein U9N01_03655 [Euryarchaeota archaeon]|nr:hypothetical protein [Euryarchaeota archaeon]